MCIKVLGGSHRRYAGIGDIIKGFHQRSHPRGKVKKGDVYNAVVVRTVRRSSSDRLCQPFSTTMRLCCLTTNQQPIGTRIFGPVTRELRKYPFMKISQSLAPGSTVRSRTMAAKTVKKKTK